VVRVACALRGEDHLPADVAADERETGRRRALQGIPGADVLTAYRSWVALLRDEFLRIARVEGITADAVLIGVQRIWRLGDHCGNEFLAGHRTAEIDVTRRKGQQETTLLAHLLEGTMTTSRLVAAGVGLNLAADKNYWVLRARSAVTDPFSLARVLKRAAGAQATALIGTYGGDVAAVLSRPVTGGLADGVTAGLAGPTTPSRLRDGFAEATQLLDVATRSGHRGIVDNRRMALRLAVAKHTCPIPAAVDPRGRCCHVRSRQHFAPPVGAVHTADRSRSPGHRHDFRGVVGPSVPPPRADLALPRDLDELIEQSRSGVALAPWRPGRCCWA
jgi:hypothetical protein